MRSALVELIHSSWEIALQVVTQMLEERTMVADLGRIGECFCCRMPRQEEDTKQTGSRLKM